MTVHTPLPQIAYVTPDLDAYAAALADFASAIDRRDRADVMAALHRLDAIDADTGHALTDYLIFTELFVEDW